jgi:hypothetical protein
MSKSVLQVVAHKLSFLLRDRDVAVIENIRCLDGSFLIEGRLGKEGSFSFPATQENIRELLDAAQSAQVVSAPVQEAVGSDLPSRKKAAPVAALSVAPKPAPESKSWLPPTKPVITDRKKLSKPGEQDLFLQFTRVNSDPYKGRKKLSEKETEAKEAVYFRNEIAKSFILAGDRTTVKNWIAFLKQD